jgi:O-acetyl-ADP-ribose deacetylase (regulator of RNase III)
MAAGSGSREEPSPRPNPQAVWRYNPNMNTVVAERVLPNSQTIQIVQGDITAETTGAIVNAANAHLQHGAGVAGAIVRRGGVLIQQESDAWVRTHGPVSHAHPAWTSGGLLPAKYLIHAVGPVWGDGAEDSKLSAAVHGSLEVADELKLESISMPAISTGIFGFPKERAAHVMLSTIRNYFAHRDSKIELVRLVLFDDATLKAFLAEWTQEA